MTRRFFDRTRIGCGRYAYTLTELLVVITIVVILVAATLPIAKRVMDDSRTRDSGRLLAGNFAMARTYAARNNRPFGLWFELARPVGYVDPALATAPRLRQCTQVYLAEVAPPYGGSTTNSRGIIRIEAGQTQPEFNPLNGQDTTPADGIVDVDAAEKPILLSLIEPGDTCLVKFEFKGDWFRLIRGGGANPIAPYTDPTRLYYVCVLPNVAGGSMSGLSIPPAYGSNTSFGQRFQILRMPRRVGNPIEMIAGTCIDIELSGMGNRGLDDPDPTVDITLDAGFGQAQNRIVVMFTPGGAIDGLMVDNGLFAASGTLHFLIGQLAKVNEPTLANPDHPTNLNMFDPNKSNLADVNSVWVSVGRLNGQISTTENLIPPVQTTPPPTPTSLVIFPGDPRQVTIDPSQPAGRGIYMQYCREPAIGREQMGGK
jgi:prepilin-type N-terminal cleavage/methylation domain-containing protein